MISRVLQCLKTLLLFFSVARSAQPAQAERAKEAHEGEAFEEDTEKLPADKLVDITAEALRMSNPFSAYWQSAA